MESVFELHHIRHYWIDFRPQLLKLKLDQLHAHQPITDHKFTDLDLADSIFHINLKEPKGIEVQNCIRRIVDHQFELSKKFYIFHFSFHLAFILCFTCQLFIPSANEDTIRRLNIVCMLIVCCLNVLEYPKVQHEFYFSRNTNFCHIAMSVLFTISFVWRIQNIQPVIVSDMQEGQV